MLYFRYNLYLVITMQNGRCGFQTSFNTCVLNFLIWLRDRWPAISREKLQKYKQYKNISSYLSILQSRL